MYKADDDTDGYFRLCQIIGRKGVTVEEADANRARGVGPKRPKLPIPAIVPVSKSSWWAGVKSGLYPQPEKLSSRTTVWRKQAIWGFEVATRPAEEIRIVNQDYAPSTDNKPGLVVSFSVGNRASHTADLRQVAGSFDALADSVLAARNCAVKDGPYICGPLREGRRNTASVLPISFCALDLDQVTDEFDLLRIIEAAERWHGMGYTTHSHCPEAGIFKMRLLFELDRAVSRREYPRISAAVAAGLSRLAGVPVEYDVACAKPEQALYTVRQGATVWKFDGEPVRVDQALASVPNEPEAAPAGLDRIKATDPTLITLRDAGRILRDMGGGKYAIRCPFEDEHSTAHTTDDTSTVYLLPHTRGFAGGHFKCQHQHCVNRTDEDFRAALNPAGKGVMDDASRSTVAEVATVSVASRDIAFDDDHAALSWGVPEPLYLTIHPESYPLEAVPVVVRLAIEEVQAFVQAPLPLVASCALAALSLATQARADVKRAERLQGPIGLYFLLLADSGERKTTVDTFFTSAIRTHEAEQAELAKPGLKKYAADMAAWEAERDGVLQAIKQTAKGGKPVERLRASLLEIEHHMPEAPRAARLIYGDATPEALTWSLAKTWPSGGVISSEAGAIFGAHGMGRDSVMRNLATLNQLWDGVSQRFDRRKEGGSFVLTGARLTMALQVQEAPLRMFFERSGSLARGTGFLARFLVAWPESTQGQRPFAEPPEFWPALAAFNRRIAEILAEPVELGEGGSLSLPVLELTPEAKSAWIDFHDAIEAELSNGGELYDIRDVASKAADNAARLAALFHLFRGAGGSIDADDFVAASRIVAWHLNESRRFFGELALPFGMRGAGKLNDWLVEFCNSNQVSEVSSRTVLQGGPPPLRDRAILDATVRELEEFGRARMVKRGRQKLIVVNPALLKGASDGAR